MSAIGNAWHWEGIEERNGKSHEEIPFLRAVARMTGESSPPMLIRWWASVLREGAEYREHKHDGKWAFVYHLTAGAAVHFGERDAPMSFPAMPGQILVFDSKTPHWTDKVSGHSPRVSIAGNLYFHRLV